MFVCKKCGHKWKARVVAVKPLSAGGAGAPPGASVDRVAFEQVMKRSGKRNKQQAKAAAPPQQQQGQGRK